MNRNDLYEGFQNIDDDILARSEKRQQPGKKTRWARWGTMAACLCLVVAGVWGIRNWQGQPELPPTPVDPIVTPDINTPGTTLATSNTYTSLDELLAHLSTHDYHAATLGDGGNGAADARSGSMQITEGSGLVAYRDCAYHIGEGQVVISDLSGTEPARIGTLDADAEQLFICDDRLVLVKSFASGGSELDEEISTSVKLYDLTDPAAPTLSVEFVQLGSINSCYLSNGSLYLLTGDGVCACGWSRLDDVEDYVPKLSQNGAPIAWENEDISILGEPSSVQYVAATKIDVATGEIADKQAFYGDIGEVFFGPDWLAIVTLIQTEQLLLHPDIYTFGTENGFVHTGKISTAAMLGLPGGVAVNGDGQMPDGDYPYVRAITKVDGIYRMIGVMSRVRGDSSSTQLLAITADLSASTCEYAVLGLGDEQHFGLDDLVWDGDRAIVTVCVTEIISYDVRQEAQFVFAEFDGTDIRMMAAPLCTDHVDGVDMTYILGNPFGELHPLLPMGNGIWLRYNGTPDGLDVFDFSDSSAPALLYDSPGDIPKECRFELIWEVYDQHTFGILFMTPDAQGDFRNAAFAWNIYRVDTGSEEPYTLVSSLDLGGGSFLGSSLGFETMEHDGMYYCVTRNADTVYRLAW